MVNFGIYGDSNMVGEITAKYKKCKYTNVIKDIIFEKSAYLFKNLSKSMAHKIY